MPALASSSHREAAVLWLSALRAPGREDGRNEAAVPPELSMPERVDAPPQPLELRGCHAMLDLCSGEPALQELLVPHDPELASGNRGRPAVGPGSRVGPGSPEERGGFGRTSVLVV